MAVVNRNSTRIANATASPVVMDNVNNNHGRSRRQVATVELVSGDSIGSTIRMAKLHSSWAISEIVLYCDAITTCAADVGLYLSNGGAVVDVDAYASAQSLATAITVGTNIAYEARNIDKIENLIWQDAGQTKDPGVYYDLTLTLTAAAGSAGTVSVEVYYASGD